MHRTPTHLPAAFEPLATPRRSLIVKTLVVALFVTTGCSRSESSGANATGDPVRDLQRSAVETGRCSVVHWGTNPDDYTQWQNHTNRIVPVFAFGTKGQGDGIDLASYAGKRSVYRDEAGLRKLYGRLPPATLNPDAGYFDQTAITEIQEAALEAGKKQIILVVFDGLDWHGLRASSIYRTGKSYDEGRGAGHFLQEYDADGTTQFGEMVTSPFGEAPRLNVDTQAIAVPTATGGYDVSQAGPHAWSTPTEPNYIKGLGSSTRHTYTDSAASATSMHSGIKTFNGSINVAADGRDVKPFGRLAQEKGYSAGVVTSVPVSHATPACAYANNVLRGDYQDITRDMLGLPSVRHPDQPLEGLDVLIGAGHGCDVSSDSSQGANFVAGNKFLTRKDLEAIDHQRGGKYLVSQRTAGRSGRDNLLADAVAAGNEKLRLFGYYGTRDQHLPYRTADGDYTPTVGKERTAEIYSPADIEENPTLADMTEAALIALSARDKPFWLLVEAGDVDWASHDNNVDNMIGAIESGDDAVRTITKWVEENSSWQDAVMIVTSDHGHYFVVRDLAAFGVLSGK
ncbi:Alkaline phosphatase 4 precursor [Planctomycetes bacterium Pan216]|uniref:Alkaline phosphatase 4 n=1 Tax=Kolteria novifilia TaxID=2527975 RepID=A0A518AX27_9BACT|nr:Alkaline phosphatase 4 precursor [Planctomycetes bacterium Pan216]